MNLRQKLLSLLCLFWAALAALYLGARLLPVDGLALALAAWGCWRVLAVSFSPLLAAVQDLGEVVSAVEAASSITFRTSQGLADSRPPAWSAPRRAWSR